MAAGLVTKYLRKLIARQIEDRPLVVWYDPERAYATAARTLDIADAAVARYDGSFLKLRREIDPLLNGLQRPG
jgi:hypothetical protein